MNKKIMNKNFFLMKFLLFSEVFLCMEAPEENRLQIDSEEKRFFFFFFSSYFICNRRLFLFV